MENLVLHFSERKFDSKIIITELARNLNCTYYNNYKEKEKKNIQIILILRTTFFKMNDYKYYYFKASNRKHLKLRQENIQRVTR